MALHLNPENNTPAIDGSLPMSQIASDEFSHCGVVKSVREDCMDVTPYFSSATDAEVIRTEYLNIDPVPIKGLVMHMDLMPSFFTEIKLLNLPSIPFTLNINGINVCNFSGHLDITSHKGNMLDVMVNVCREFAEGKGKDLPDVRCLFSEAFDTIKICCPSTFELPREVKVQIKDQSGDPHVISLYPHNTYALNMRGPTDHILISYSKTLSSEPSSRSITFRGYNIDMTSASDSGVICIKLQDPAESTVGVADPDPELMRERNFVNFSRLSGTRLVLDGISVSRVIQCCYVSYYIPTTSSLMKLSGQGSGALEPKYS